MTQNATSNEVADEALLAVLRFLASREDAILSDAALVDATDLVHRARFDDALIIQLQSALGSGVAYLSGRKSRRAEIDRLWAHVETHGLDALREECRARLGRRD